jgi:hypothetical protein
MDNNNNDLLKHSLHSNTNQQILTLNQETNTKLTLNSNASLTSSQKIFLGKATSINEIEKRPFSVNDFPTLTKSNFRQKIHELKSFLIKVVDGRPSFYKVKDIELPGDSHSITLKHTGVDTTQLETLLLNCKNQPACLHDIRFKINSDLHSLLLKKGLTQDEHNGCIVVNSIPSPNSNLSIKSLVYPTHIQLIIGCAFKPIIYNSSSIQDLIFNLGRYVELLRLFVNDDFSIQAISEWICVGYHFNKDGTLEVHDANFHYHFEDFSNMMLRIYTKSFPDETKKLRVEETKNPNIPLADMAKDVLEN